MGCTARLFVTVVTCVLLGRPPAAGGASPLTSQEKCIGNFHEAFYIKMCHGPSRNEVEDPDVCVNPERKGLVVEELYAGSLENKGDCAFSINNLLRVECMKRETHMTEEYDQIIFDILDKLSGKGKIAEDDLLVDRLPLEPPPTVPPNVASSASNNGSAVSLTSPQGSKWSAFIVFKETCKEATPDPRSDHGSDQGFFKVINFCSNHTVNDTRVYLTVRGTDTSSLPAEPSMCRCTVRQNTMSVGIDLLALDIRLQNYTTHECGGTELELKWNGDSKTIPCKGKSAIYGSRNLLDGKGTIRDVTLTLSSVSADVFPTAVWIEAVEEKSFLPIEVTCEGFLPMPEDISDGSDDGDENNSDASDAGLGMPVIVGLAAGISALVIIVIVSAILIVRRRHTGSFLPKCSGLCSRGDGKGKPKSVPAVDVYSEPHSPRPSNPQPYVFPSSPDVTNLLDDEERVYAEPQERPFFMTLPPPSTPPPLPDSPPPSSPPPGTSKPDTFEFDTGTGPPKPKRTFAETTVPGGHTEDYDHIDHTSDRPKLKPASLRDRQNNIVMGDDKENGDDTAPANVYDRADFDTDHSKMSASQRRKLQVGDNNYEPSWC